MTRPHPRTSTPFPYTTLFRSVVTLTSPSSGATVSGTIGVSASVSPLGLLVRGVQFKLDGGNLGAEDGASRSEEHTSELQSRRELVCRLLLEKKKHVQM